MIKMKINFDIYSNGMLEIAQTESQRQVKQYQKLLESSENDLQSIETEQANRLKQSINETIQKVQEGDNQTYV